MAEDDPGQECWIAGSSGRIYARWWGERPSESAPAPIILFHDSLGCVALWRDFPARLATETGRPVIAYDRLGFGRSDACSGALSMDFIDAEADGGFRLVTEAFGINRFVAVGHSVGGGMATVCAAGYGERCKGLITISAQAFVEDLTLAGIRQAQSLVSQSDHFARLQRYHGDKARWVLDAWVNTWLAPEFADWSLETSLAAVQCPVLAIHGAQDEYGSLAQMQAFADMSAGLAVPVVLEKCGHIPHRERPDALLAVIRKFLLNVAPRREMSP